MKKTLTGCVVGIVVAIVIVIFSPPSYASDWDVAGKVLTGIEGLRIVTGGNIDVIGTLTGINREKEYVSRSQYSHHPKKKRYSQCAKKVWVPEYIWKKKYIPRHTEYSEKYGEVIVEAHYITYKVERGGDWVSVCSLK